MWWMLAAAAMSAAQQAVASKSGVANALAQNQAAAESNLQNTIRTGYRVGLLNLQAGQAKQNAVQAGLDISKQATQILGANTANAAAAGTIGASVDAVAGDIQKRADEAKLNVDTEYEVYKQNFNTQLQDLVMSGQDAMRAPLGVPKFSIGTALVGAGANMAMQYASQKMSLGLGPKPDTPKMGSGSSTQFTPST